MNGTYHFMTTDLMIWPIRGVGYTQALIELIALGGGGDAKTSA